MLAVRSGSLDGVRRYTVSLEPHHVRPILESAVVIGFKDGASLAVLEWMARRVGTLCVSRTPLRRHAPEGAPKSGLRTLLFTRACTP
jgi:hypothetical protein